MLHSISWGQFISVLLPLAIIFYVYVLLKYYRNELTAFFFGREGRGDRQVQAPAVAHRRLVLGKTAVLPGQDRGRHGGGRAPV